MVLEKEAECRKHRWVARGRKRERVKVVKEGVMRIERQSRKGEEEEEVEVAEAGKGLQVAGDVLAMTDPVSLTRN